MRTTFTTLLALLLFSMTGAAANQPANRLLPVYLSIKDALVNSDANAAAVKATDFEAALSAVPAEKLSSAEKKNFEALKSKLLKDAGQIAKNKNLDKQRNAFESLSSGLIQLSKSLKLSERPVYIQYCPMKKASWLSTENVIKNPYYGKQMLECGQTKETI